MQALSLGLDSDHMFDAKNMKAAILARMGDGFLKSAYEVAHQNCIAYSNHRRAYIVSCHHEGHVCCQLIAFA